MFVCTCNYLTGSLIDPNGAVCSCIVICLTIGSTTSIIAFENWRIVAFCPAILLWCISWLHGWIAIASSLTWESMFTSFPLFFLALNIDHRIDNISFSIICAETSILDRSSIVLKQFWKIEWSIIDLLWITLTIKIIWTAYFVLKGGFILIKLMFFFTLLAFCCYWEFAC